MKLNNLGVDCFYNSYLVTNNIPEQMLWNIILNMFMEKEENNVGNTMSNEYVFFLCAILCPKNPEHFYFQKIW